jgi:AhpD family alkylhydroperoxidase
MSPRLNFEEYSQEHTKKLVELSYTKSSLEPKLKHLVDIRASQINGCGFCLDMHVKEAKIHGERELRLYHVSIWKESNLFTEKERAALAWTEALTNVTDHKAVDAALPQLKEHFSEKEICDLTFAIGTINLWNRLNVAAQNEPGTKDAMYGLTKAGLN